MVHASALDRAPRPALFIGTAVVAVLALNALGWPASMYQDSHSDMPQFWRAGRVLLDGRLPYEVWNWPYPLWTAVLLLPLGSVPLTVAAPIWLVSQLTAIAIALRAVAARVLVTDPRRDAVLLAAIAVSMQPLWLLVGGGNMTGLVFAAFAGAFAAQLARRPALAGSLLGLLIAKPNAFLLAVPVFALAVDARARPRLIAAGLAVAAALVAASFGVRADWLGMWLTNAAALGSSSGSNATGWTVGRALVPGMVAALLSVAGSVFVVGTFALWWWRRRPPFVLIVAAAVPVSLYVSPHGWSYDHLHLLITYAVALELIARTGASRLRWLMALMAIACPIPWLLYASAFVTGGEDQAAVIPVLALALLLALDLRTARSGAPAPSLATSATTP